MKKWVIATVVLMCFVAKGYSDISVLPQQTKSDYFGLQQLERLILVNSSPKAIKGSLKYTIYDESGFRVAEARSRVLTLEKGSNVLSGKLGLEFSEVIDASFGSFYHNNGYFLMGSYKICVDVLTEATIELLHQHCFEIRAGRLLNLQLSKPFNKSSLTELQSWSWIPVAGFASTELEYVFELKEIREEQSPEEAMAVNFAHVKEAGLSQNLLLNQPAYKKLEFGKSYSWQVRAYFKSKEVARSEVWTFEMLEESIEEKEWEGILPVAKSKEIPEFIVDDVQLNFKPEDRMVKDYDLRIVDVENNRNVLKEAEVLVRHRDYLNIDLQKALGRARDKKYLVILTDKTLGKNYYLQILY